MGGFVPAGTVTGIGSLPHTDPARAVDFVVRRAPRLPFWPQLPRRRRSEGLVEQALERFGRSPRFGPEGAAGFFAFLDAWDAGRFPRAVGLKGQVVGPLTLARVAPDLGAGSLAAHVLGLARWQLAALQDRARGRPVTLWLDEPCLGLPEARAGDLDLLGGVVEGLRREGACVGLHCCSPPPWEWVRSLAPEVVSFDASQGFEACAADPRAFLLVERTPCIAWGIVDARRPAPRAREPVLARWRDAAAAFGTPGDAAARSLFTASCGLAGRSETEAEEHFAFLEGFATEAVTLA
ncbi:MAG: hypothetical protein D6731_16835 [Planctomycetota bacterium]|nr:MAG: hypothetical protein D6731_16835 [Planctomycetota bacterium]